MTIILAPAYGRVYTNKTQVLNDWNAGKDFVVLSIVHGRGTYTSKNDLPKEFTGIEFRYGKQLEKVYFQSR